MRMTWSILPALFLAGALPAQVPAPEPPAAVTAAPTSRRRSGAGVSRPHGSTRMVDSDGRARG